MVLSVIVVTACLGIDTNQSTIYQIYTLLLSILSISIISSFFFKAKFNIKRKPPKFATVGESLVYTIEILNLTKKKQYGLFLYENSEDLRPTFDELLNSREPGEENRNVWDRKVLYHRWLWLIDLKRKCSSSSYKIPSLSPNGRADVSVILEPLKRGFIHLSGVTITRPDPFGLFNSFVNILKPEKILVLPKRYKLPSVNLPGTRKYHSGGIALASSIGNSDEFVSLRDYRPGDPIRQIHWKSWAKTGDLIVKEYQDEFFVRHALILDTYQEKQHSEIFEQAVSVASSFVCSIGTQESLLDLMFIGEQAYSFSSGRGMSQYDKLLEILACVKACNKRDVSDLLPKIIEYAPLLSGCVCVFLTWDDERKEIVKKLIAFNVPVKVLVITDSISSLGSIDPGPMKSFINNFHILETDNIEEGLSKI
jgi:hypothetical protein